jgi:hypothetical protein
MAKTSKLSKDELLELGKKLQSFYDSGYINRKQAILFSFYKGLASGLGAFLGGTIMIGLLIWLLSIFGHVPILGHFVNLLRNTTSKKNNY